MRLLKEADVVFVPGRKAEKLVAPYQNAVVLEFPMIEDEAAIEQCLQANADKIAIAAREGLAIFALLGDPNFFSTFSRLCKIIELKYPDIHCKTEPGVSSITACAAVAGISISNSFIVSDGSEPHSIILLKVKKPREAAQRLRQKGYREFVLVERIFMEDERIYEGNKLPESSDYMSILVAQ